MAKRLGGLRIKKIEAFNSLCVLGGFGRTRWILKSSGWAPPLLPRPQTGVYLMLPAPSLLEMGTQLGFGPPGSWRVGLRPTLLHANALVARKSITVARGMDGHIWASPFRVALSQQQVQGFVGLWTR